MHDAVKQSLASRISGASRPGASRSQSGSGGSSLAARLSSGPSAKGRELISSGSSSSSKAPTPKLHGFDAPVPVNTNANLNAGVELFPTRAKRTSGSVLDSRVVASGIAAAGLGQQRVQRQQQRTVPLQTQYAEPTAHTSSVSIFGAAKTSIVVRVENLAPGTTPDDVMVSGSLDCPSRLVDGCSPLSRLRQSYLRRKHHRRTSSLRLTWSSAPAARQTSSLRSTTESWLMATPYDSVSSVPL